MNVMTDYDVAALAESIIYRVDVESGDGAMRARGAVIHMLNQFHTHGTRLLETQLQQAQTALRACNEECDRYYRELICLRPHTD